MIQKIKYLALLLFCSQAAALQAQNFTVDTLQFSGDISKCINMVILGDGYQQSELNKLSTDAKKFTADFFEAAPYLQYRSYFNVFAVKVPSNQSGASHPGTATDVTEPAHPVSVVDNYFGSTFDSYGMHRLITLKKPHLVFNVLANNFPSYDLIVILVNSTYYGGSGGQFAITSMHSSSSEIAIHEIGHSFAALEDEYYAGDSYASEGINMTQQTNPQSVRWKNWHGDKGIGIYQHCCGGNSAKWYKPHTNCKMQNLGVPFCAVCTEGTIEKIHELCSPVKSQKRERIHEYSSTSFSLQLIKPVPNTLKTKWFLNDNPVAINTDSITILDGALKKGTNTIQCTVEDTTSLIRVTSHSHTYQLSWSVFLDATGNYTIHQATNKVEWNLYPNPTKDRFLVEWKSSTNKTFQVRITNAKGEILLTETNLQSSMPFDISLLPTGIYFVHLMDGKVVVSTKKLVKE